MSFLKFQSQKLHGTYRRADKRNPKERPTAEAQNKKPHSTLSTKLFAVAYECLLMAKWAHGSLGGPVQYVARRVRTIMACINNPHYCIASTHGDVCATLVVTGTCMLKTGFCLM